jgi:hypothetical protein
LPEPDVDRHEDHDEHDPENPCRTGSRTCDPRACCASDDARQRPEHEARNQRWQSERHQDLWRNIADPGGAQGSFRLAVPGKCGANREVPRRDDDDPDGEAACDCDDASHDLAAVPLSEGFRRWTSNRAEVPASNVQQLCRAGQVGQNQRPRPISPQRQATTAPPRSNSRHPNENGPRAPRCSKATMPI